MTDFYCWSIYGRPQIIEAYDADEAAEKYVKKVDDADGCQVVNAQFVHTYEQKLVKT